MAGGSARMIRIERRLEQPRWLAVAVPVGSLARGVRRDDARPARHRTIAPLHTFWRLIVTGFGSTFALELDVRRGDAAALHRALRRGRVPDAASSTSAARGSSTCGAILGAAAGIALGNHSGWLSVPAMIAAGARRRRRVRADPGHPAGLPLDERDHHLADAQLRRGARHRLPDLRLAFLLARHIDARARRCSRRGRCCPDAATWPVLHVGGLELPLGLLLGRRRCAAFVWVLYSRTTVRLRGAGDRRLARARRRTPACARAGRSSP